PGGQRGLRSVRPRREAADARRTAPSDEAMAQVRMAAVGPAADQDQRSLRRPERRDTEVLHARLALVLPPTRDDRAPRGVCHPAWEADGRAVLLRRSCLADQRRAMEGDAREVEPRSRHHERLAGTGAAWRRTSAGRWPDEVRSPESEAAQAHGADRRRRKRSWRRGLGAVRR